MVFMCLIQATNTKQGIFGAVGHEADMYYRFSFRSVNWATQISEAELSLHLIILIQIITNPMRLLTL